MYSSICIKWALCQIAYVGVHVLLVLLSEWVSERLTLVFTWCSLEATHSDNEDGCQSLAGVFLRVNEWHDLCEAVCYLRVAID